jgi:hypothetical protein
MIWKYIKKKIMKGIYRFKYDYGRMGELSGIFVADSEHIKQLVGSYVALAKY